MAQAPGVALGRFFIKHRSGLYVHPHKGTGEVNGYLVLCPAGPGDPYKERLLFCIEDGCVKHCRTGLFVQPRDETVKDNCYLVLRPTKSEKARMLFRDRYWHHVQSQMIVHPFGGLPKQDTWLVLHGDARTAPEERVMWELEFEHPLPATEINLVQCYARLRNVNRFPNGISVAVLLTAILRELEGLSHITDARNPTLIARADVTCAVGINELKGEIDRHYYAAYKPISCFQPDELAVLTAAYLLASCALEIPMSTSDAKAFFGERSNVAVAAHLCGWLQQFEVFNEDLLSLFELALACISRFKDDARTLHRFLVISAT